MGIIVYNHFLGHTAQRQGPTNGSCPLGWKELYVICQPHTVKYSSFKS